MSRSSAATLARNARTASPSTPRRAAGKLLCAISSGLTCVLEETETTCGSSAIANSLRRWSCYAVVRDIRPPSDSRSWIAWLIVLTANTLR